jgi:uncharacterized RDD family membrane protein YckC
MVFCAKCGKEVPPESSFCPSCGAPASPSRVAQGVPVSGFDALIKEGRAQGYWFRRLIAFAIDAIIVDVALGIIGLIMAVPMLLAGGVAAVASLFAGIFSVISGIVLVFYFAITETATGASIGKHILGLRVRAKAGAYPNFGEALVRNVSKIYWVLLLIDVVVGLATSKAYTEKLSDRFMGTSVQPA